MMKMKFWLPALLLLFAALIYLVPLRQKPAASGIAATVQQHEREEEETPARFVRARLQYEFDMLKNPVTGTIPADIQRREKAFARRLPVKQAETYFANGTLRTAANNTYIPAGPNNIGGRTRAVAYDRRFNGASNRVIIAGSVSGGILRSADGGNSWTRVSPTEDIHNLTALAQDPLNPDVWYAGGGEAIGNTADDLGTLYLGFGIWKSTNNGVSWTRLTRSITNFAGTDTLPQGFLEAFDNPFDFAHRIAVNPVNSHVYIAGHRRIIRSTDGGASFRVVLEGAELATAGVGQTDVVISNTGRVFACINGGNPDRAFRGLWVSSSGNPNTYSRVAGGQTIGVDSVDGWRGNAIGSESKRLILALAPSNNNIGYAYYENGLSGEPPALQPEADLFHFTISGNTFTWSNRSASMPDFPGGNLPGSDPLALQGGYNMEVTVKPDDPNTVFIGGTNLYRSTDGFTTSNNTAWIGGYQTNFSFAQYPQSHADIHLLTFHPTIPNQAICANDGGVQETMDITAPVVTWRMLPNYQTLQCYNIAIDPGTGRNNIASGSQDNGVHFRDASGLYGTPPAEVNNHRLLFSADGAYVGISLSRAGDQFLYESIQLGRLFRVRLGVQGTTEITPNGLTPSSPNSTNEFGEFVTNLRLEADNTDNLYYVNFNRLFRTTSASTVTRGSWTELTGVSQAVNPGNPSSGRNVVIRGLGFSRGPNTSASVLYIGTSNGRIFRLNDPQNALPSQPPVDITPLGLQGNVQDIATNPNNDDEVMAVISNYGVISIWWTSNGKSASPTWRQAEGNLTLPSIRSCAIVVKKDAANQPVTEYYVGTSVGLYSAINLGTTLTAGQEPVWQREGGDVLNFAVVTSLAYRPVDNVLAVGTHGNGIYFAEIGSPNFTPGLNTGITPITNDRNFIRAVYPTVSAGNVQYQIGNLPGVRRLSVQLTNLKGQVVYREDRGYQNGSIPMQNLGRGLYVLQILSNDNRYRHIQKLVKP